ncbi:polyadenylate-binding protein [Dioscorea alata]|uniref:Polyadenylate-binding protein n=1 Tax=Dioscorea alata TaxID=55571 RepID=A0ACB7UAW2_DIOAL|nr:polyadenylate-binding protein [Dioscorea alata]
MAPPLSSPRFRSSPTFPDEHAFSDASLYVGDLDLSVTDGQLFDFFNRFGSVASVRVCRDRLTRVSLGYGYVNFPTRDEALRVLELLNFTSLNGKPVRIMFSNRDPSFRKSGVANIFIKNLDPTIDSKSLYDVFVTFGLVLTCKVATNSDGQSKGYGFVQFEQEEDAHRAVNSLNSMLVNGRKVFVGFFQHRQVREKINGPAKFKNVYVKNLAETVTKEDLIEKFGTCGHIDSAVVMVDANGNSRGFGFVDFLNPDDAAAAVERLNGSVFHEKVLYVGRAEKKAERKAQLKAKFEQDGNKRLAKLQEANLYVKNLDDSIDDEKLREIFRPFGNLGSCKVMCDAQGYSKGFGFVAFLSSEDAARAVHELNGHIIGKKPLFISVAQSKEERKAKLQVHFTHLRALAERTPSMPLLPPHQPNAHALNGATPQMYFGPGASSNLIPHQSAINGFQQHPIQRFRPVIPPHYMIPYHPQRQGQHGQRMGFGSGGAIPPQQFVSRNWRQGFPHMQNAVNGPNTSLISQTPIVSSTRMGSRNSPSSPIAVFASLLASASPDQQRTILGNELYPLVEAIDKDHAAKVTGMLLEMGQNEVLHLLQSPETLKEKVNKALEVSEAAE